MNHLSYAKYKLILYFLWMNIFRMPLCIRPEAMVAEKRRNTMRGKYAYDISNGYCPSLTLHNANTTYTIYVISHILTWHRPFEPLAIYAWWLQLSLGEIPQRIVPDLKISIIIIIIGMNFRHQQCAHTHINSMNNVTVLLDSVRHSRNWHRAKEVNWMMRDMWAGIKGVGLVLWKCIAM